jgi:2-polyprenyl-3-methyl-5-hydroxy-6-metoxy-1,4-benzoquinol methylase/Zn ribbon nucleic-acid-binding protein
LEIYDRRVRPLAGGPAVVTVACPVCDGRDAIERFAVDGIEAPILECAECGLARFEPMLAPEVVSALYPSDYYGDPGAKFVPAVEWWVRAIAARHARFLSAGLARGARVLDVGCGRGIALGPLVDRGFEAHGLEVSRDALRGVDPRAHVRIAPDLVAAGYAARSFDQIVIWHVLEHLRDPRGTLEECHRILRPGGRLVVAVPNYSSWQARLAGPGWFHLDAPRHLYQFPLPALHRLIERCGFECRSTHHFSLRQNPFGWIQSLQNRLDPEHPNRLYTALHSPSQRVARNAGARLSAALWLALGALPAVAMSVVAAAARRGATVHVVATRRQS